LRPGSGDDLSDAGGGGEGTTTADRPGNDTGGRGRASSNASRIAKRRRKLFGRFGRMHAEEAIVDIRRLKI
jgi:hypothetical protein